MLEALCAGLTLIASWENALALLCGMFGGVVIGALPGLTGAMAVTLALPFTFYIPPITSLMLLLGIYKGSMYGGSISAILIRTPGTAAAACTVLDGYPLAERGEAGRALNMALYASCFADMVSNLALIFFTGAIADFALRFGPPEFFSLICFSLTIVAGLAGDSLIKGLLSACLGLLMATVGMDLVFGTGRFTFDNVNLMAGLSFIPLVIGLFAIPEILKAVAGGGGAASVRMAVGASRVTWAEFRRCFKSIVRGSLIGVVMGAIPGIGGAPAAYLSYSEAKRYSPRRENFGKGELEGVAAAESGNNGVCGATLIPLLSLGVPGDIVTAVMLGAFMMHNITPGPLLFQENLPLVYALYAGILFSSFLLFVSGILCIRGVASLTRVPKAVLFPCVLTICLFGAYAVNNSEFDLLVMACMGLVGYGMSLFRIAEAPFLVAFILGPLFEDNLRRSLLLSHGDPAILWSTPICWFFLLLTAVSLAVTLRKEIGKARRAAESSAVSAEAAPGAAASPEGKV